MTLDYLEFFRKGRADLSNFLIHLTKDGTYEEWRPAGYGRDGFFYGPSTTLRAEDSLRTILTAPTPTLQARSPFGIFKLLGINIGATKKKDIHPDWLKCVCFSETPLRELAGFYRATQDPKNWSLKANRYQKFGLAFEATYIRAKGGHPIFYYDRAQPAIQSAVEKMAEPGIVAVTQPLLPYFEPYGPKVLDPRKEIDFRWEREWRIRGDLAFNLTDVAFGICAENRIAEFETLVSGKFPFIDPDWDIAKLKESLEKQGWAALAAKL